MTEIPRELTSEEVRNPFDPDSFEFDTTDSLPGNMSIIGQERALQAIDFGINIAAFGFNIYALGLAGTGRTTTIHTFLNQVAAEQPVPPDLVYVNDFQEPNQPRAIELPPGEGVRLRRDMQELVTDLLREIPRAFESEDYEAQREQTIRDMQEQRNQVLAELEHKVTEEGFAMLKSATGLVIAPVLNGQVLAPDAYRQLDKTTQDRLEQRQAYLHGEMAEATRLLRGLDKEAKKRLQEFDRQIADFAVGHLIDDLRQEYGHLQEVDAYLQEVHADIVENVDRLREEDGEGSLASAVHAGHKQDLLNRYQVNLLVDHSEQQGAPVIFESNPTYSNLAGRIEHRSELGSMVTDFTMIKPGALHRANGGFLVLETETLLANPLAWDALKRTLKNRQIRTEEAGSQLQLITTPTLEPEPIAFSAKVVLIGDPVTYYLLQEYDQDFQKLFKVQADFGDIFPRTPQACNSYARFVAARCQQEQLVPFDRTAVARVVEFGSRLAEHQHKLSSRFGEIADVVREASFWARRAGRELATAQDVDQALEQRVYRANRIEEEALDAIAEGFHRIQVTGEALGQVNGLSVLSLGNHNFGRPSRITVETFTGKEGVVSLDREAKLSGRIYDKGLLTLSGYLGGKYASDIPLSLSASISFEQLYDEIDGDSASSSELYALLSSLSELPIKQGIAVTGSVDQQGHVQPVGGVNEKIEGYFDTCRRLGLTGDQGVIVPARNVVNLMLRADVCQAIADGQFHIFPVDTIDEGIEILTGWPAGQADDEGDYPEDTVHGRVQERLEEIADNLRESGEEEEADESSGDCDAVF
jgi:lon-related putative ATP-dependent protease